MRTNRPRGPKLGLIAGACLAFMLLAATGCQTARTTSQTSALSKSEIYDPQADGRDLLAAAIAQAQQQAKRVLVNLGANWCADSQAMAQLFKTDRAIRQELQQHFVLVMIDTNQRDGANRNREILARFGEPLSRGIPVLLVLSPEGKLLNTDPAERLSDDAHKEPGRVRAYLQKWAGRAK